MPTSSPLASTSFYKRPLPPTCTPFNSPEGRRIFATSMQESNLDAYFLLSQHFLTQNEPAFCALGSLAMILNSLEMDPQRIWKGNWRWYSENLLDCCRPLEEVAQVGLTLPEFACLARCNGLSARVVSPSMVDSDRDRETKLEEFRRDLRKATRAEEIMAISYSRRSLKQTGSGHFSPVGAYSEADDKVLILDVARFKYPSYWISVELAYDSMVPIDDATGQPRGYVMLKPAPSENTGSLNGKQSLTSLTLNKSSWALLSNSLSRILLETPKSATLDSLLERIVSHLSSLPTPAVIVRPLPNPNPTSESPAPSRPTSPSPTSSELLSKLSTSSVPGSTSNPLVTLLVLSLFSPRSPLTALVPPHLAKGLLQTIEIDSTRIHDEVEFLTTQIGALGECCRSEEEGAGCGCATKGTMNVDKDDSINERKKCH